MMIKNVFFAVLPPMGVVVPIQKIENINMEAAIINVAIVAPHQMGPGAPIVLPENMKNNEFLPSKLLSDLPKSRI